MNRTLKSALLELRQDGVTLDAIDDLEHLLTLDALARKISCPDPIPGERAALHPTITVGGITLRRLSIGARRFLTDCVLNWYPDDITVQDTAYAFCMTLAATPEQLWALQDRDSFSAAMKAWERTIRVPRKELMDAIKDFMDEERPVSTTTPGPGILRSALATLDAWKPVPAGYRTECDAALIAMQTEQENAGENYGPIICLLIEAYGKTPEDWLWRTPESEIELLLNTLRENKEAKERQEVGRTDARFLRAHKAFWDYIEMVKKLKKGTAL